MGFGGQAGAEMTDFLIVLNSRSVSCHPLHLSHEKQLTNTPLQAVKSFMAAGSLTLGGNLSIALGPLGRNGEASGSLNSKGKMAAMYSYSRTKGLFGGISVEGSVIVERQDANAQAYKEDVSVKQLLGGEVEFPPWGEGLRRALESSAGGIWVNGWVDDRPRSRSGSPGAGTGYAFEGIGVGKDVTGSSASSRDGGGSLGRKKSSSFSGWGMGGKKSSSISSPVPFDPTLDDPSHRTSNSISSPKPKLSKTKPTPKSILDEPNPFDSSDPYTISDGMANLALSNARKRDRETNPGFSTHFDSDFDPTAPHPTSHSRSNSNSNSNSQSYPHSSITKKDSFDEDFDLPSSTHPQDKRNSFEEDFTFPSNPPPLKKLPFSSGVALGGLYTTSTKKTPLPKPLLSRTGSSSPGLGAGLFKNASNPFQFRPITPPGQTQPSTPPLNSYAVYSRGGVQRRLSQKKTLLDDDEEEDAGEGKGIALFDFKAQQVRLSSFLLSISYVF
jgi:hypothetical protein